ncbi:hypothetical protein ACF09C_24210 [Streptomyces sp. NPDC014870]|uniref:hypothetical protein n=1 Tax=Streptomyces sp. NPDC014870 TaxID=3364925 RepID=UPI0036F54057
MPRWAIVLLVVVGSTVVLVPIAVMVGFVYVYGENHKNMRFPSDDVTVARCAVDPVSRRPVAELTVTSQAAVKGTYTVMVDFQGREGRFVETGHSVVEDLAPGATGRAVVVGVRPFDDGEPRCEVMDAQFEATESVEAEPGETETEETVSP